MDKVLRVTTILDFGGVEKRLVNTATHRDPQVEFVFISLGKGGWAEREIVKLNKTVLILNRSYKIPSFTLILSLINVFRAHKPKVVHTSGAEANFHGIIAAWICRVPVIVGEEIGFPSHGKIARMIFSRVYAMCDSVIAISSAVKKKLTDLREVEAARCTVVYNPVQIPVLDEHKDRSGKLKLLMVSRLEKIKNIGMVLQFLSENGGPLPPWELHILGEGPEWEDLEKSAEDLNIADRVMFHGFCPDPTRFYAEADVFLLPSFSEGLSNSLLEAMAYGLLCVATREGGPVELIEHGKTGFLIDPYSYEHSFQTLTHALCLHVDERRAIGAAARSFINERFSVEQYIENLKSVYKIPG